MKITKKIINKIEGEAKLKVYGDEVVEWVDIEFWQYRGIERILQNRHFLDALVINPRVCGICGHSHLLATTLAIENAFGIEVSNKAKILREITTALEIVQNHIKWFYITLYPTLIKDKSFTLKALKISSFVAKIIALIGGQFPHNSYIVPGGVTCDLTNMEVLKLNEWLKELDEMVDSVILKDGKSKDLERLFDGVDRDIGRGLNRFLVLGDNLIFKSNKRCEVREEKSYSLLKNALCDGKFYEVGPLGRNLENELVKRVYKKHLDSAYSRIFARIYEVRLLIDYLLKISKEIDVCESSFIKYKPKNSKGISFIEAPRGSLIHKIEIEDEKIKRYEIIVPTQFNLSNGTKSKSPAQAALIGERMEVVDFIFKCFDVCAVCVTH